MAILPRPRQRKRTPATGDKREVILEVAGRLFFAQGYAGTGVEQIALELGVTKPFSTTTSQAAKATDPPQRTMQCST